MIDAEEIKYLQSEQQRLEAIIRHLKEGGGAEAYDSASPHVFYKKPCPPELFRKTSSDFLAEYEELLARVKIALSESV